MMRVVVPTVCCRDPFDEMFGADGAWYFQPPRTMRCRRINTRQMMTWPMLAALVDALESDCPTQDNLGEKKSCCSTQDNDEKKSCCPTQGNEENKSCCSAQGKHCCSPDSGSTDQKRNDSDSAVNPDVSAKPSSNKKMSHSHQSSEEGKVPEAVSVPMKRLDLDLDNDRFKVSLNLKTFQPEDIEVHRVGNILKINAKQQVQRHGMIFHREVQRSYDLPDDVDAETLKSTLTAAGVLSVEAQRKQQGSDSSKDHQRKEDEGSLTDTRDDQSEETVNESTMKADSDNPTEQDISTDDENTEKAIETTDEVDESKQNEGHINVQE